METKAELFIGKKYGKLTITELTGVVNKNMRCNVICDCGKELNVLLNNLKKENTTSCGCVGLKKLINRSTKHNKSKSAEYKAWRSMKVRCYTKTYSQYKDYGGRGITVCERWLNSFENFYQDMGNIPSKKHSLDRIDPNDNYNLKNCRWATTTEQSLNKRNTVKVIYKDKEITLVELSRLLKVNYNVLYNGLFKYNKTISDYEQ